MNAQGDPARLALAAVDIAFPAASDSERYALKEALEAAAIPHWCNAEILAALLQLPAGESTRRFAQLDRLNEVEPFEARGEGAVNIHEAARLALRKRMAAEEPERFRALSARAAAYFAGSPSRTYQIEWIYHRLSAAPAEGAEECEALRVEWTRDTHPADRDAIAIALYELEKTGLVQGRARLEVLVWYAENLSARGEITRLAATMPATVELANQLAYPSGQARAYDLYGELLRLQGHSQEALAAHNKVLQIRQQLAEAKPSDAVARWRVAVAYSRLGDVYQEQAEYEDALDAFTKCSAILDRLAEEDPKDPRWRRESAIAKMRRGDILRDSGQWDQALEMFQATIAPIRQLVAEDPANEDRQRDLAMSHLRIGDEMQARGRAEEARAAFGEYVRICSDILAHRPSEARSLGDLARGYMSLALVEMGQKQFESAHESLVKGRDILQPLLARDPTMAEWRMLLAVALSRIGTVHWSQEKPAEALVAFEEALGHIREISKQDPSNLSSQHEVAVALANVARLLNDLPERKADAVDRFRESSDIYAALVEAMPENKSWADERQRVDQELADARQSLA